MKVGMVMRVPVHGRGGSVAFSWTIDGLDDLGASAEIDDRGPDVGDFGPPGELKNELAQFVGSGNGDVREEVGLAGDHVHGDHIGEIRDRVAEGGRSRKRLRPDLDRHMRLHTSSDPTEIDRGVETGDDAPVLKCRHPSQAGGVGNAEFAGELPVAEPSILLQPAHDRAICFVHNTPQDPVTELVSVSSQCSRNMRSLAAEKATMSEVPWQANW